MSAKTAAITGAADGIGWAMAQVFADAGYRVLVADLDGDKAAARTASLGTDITGTTLAVDGGWSAFGDSGDASTG